MKIDLHVHIHRTSRCARAEPDEMGKAAKAKGLDGIVILDHNYFATEEDRLKARESGIWAFRGMEINVCDDDVVIISPVAPDFTLRYKEKVTGKDLDKVAEWVYRVGALAILAHPFRRKDTISFDLSRFRCHAIEAVGRHVDVKNRAKIVELAKSFDMQLVSVSDAHKTRQLGGFCIDTALSVADERDLIKTIKAGNFTAMERRMVPAEGLR